MIRLVILLCMVASSHSLTCAPCNTVRCQAPENCPGGTAKGVCGCCDVCAKVEGEECGGPWNIGGVCDKGLICDKPHDDFNMHGTCKKNGSAPQDCGENAHFDGCGHGACQPTCDRPLPVCALQCIPSCQCDDGFMLHDGKCIAEDQCPDRKCPEHSHFRKCGTCKRTCENPNPMCTRECKPPGCHCDPGYFWKEERCIPRSQCDGCSVEGGDYYPNGAKWAGETEGTNCMCLGKQVFCTPIDRSRCAKDSRFDLTWGDKYPLWTCTIGSPEKTPSEPPERKCPENSHFRRCGKGGCQPTCEEPNPTCHMGCIPSCHCDPGYVWGEGGCIPISQCGGCLLESGEYYPNGAKWASRKVGVNCMCLKKKVFCAPIDKTYCPVYSRIETSETGSHVIWTCVKGNSRKLPDRAPVWKYTTTKCEKERELALKSGAMDVFVKQCDDDGSYLPVQCYGFTGDCYCAHPHTGTLYEATRAQGRPEADCSTYWESQGGEQAPEPKTKCEIERDSAIPMPGAFIKQCDDKGKYRVVQCHGSTGYCFCANPNDGSIFDETGKRGQPIAKQDCETYWKQHGMKTKCQQERDKAAADLASGMVGLFVKECAEDGSYRTRQCHGSTGYCYCAHPEDGTVYRETGERPWETTGEGYDCDTYWKTMDAETKKEEL
ncbi:CRIM1 [Branchiostoma lanceolatum]|uniref:CRIM1 protein n=1 Tax=Branchiostoma lanceolatum TaxID=7740 RepID=A0A8J9YUV7_BRALA|nr:CRIM1 [Branchiostoma lanceolatum]